MPLSGFTAVVAAMLWDTATPALAGTAPNQYYSASPFARVVLSTSDTSLTVEAVSASGNDRDTVGVWVNGVYNQTITFTSYGVKQQLAITLPGGSKTVELVGDAYVTGVSAASYDIANKPATVASRCVVWGDSIGRGYSASPIQRSFVPEGIRRSGLFEGTTDFCVSGDSLFNWYTFGGGVAGIVSAIRSRFTDAAGGTRVLFIEMITNDYSPVFDYWSAASFASVYTALLDALHADDPGLLIACSNGFYRSGETTPQPVHGSTLADFRSAVAAAENARGYCTLFDAASVLVSGDLADGLHPNSTGHNKIGVWAAQQLAAMLPSAPVNPPSSATRELTIEKALDWESDPPIYLYSLVNSGEAEFVITQPVDDEYAVTVDGVAVTVDGDPVFVH